MKVLYVSFQDPFGVGGGSYASHAYLKAFSLIAKGNIDIVIAEECDESRDTSIQYSNLYKVPPRNIISRVFSLVRGVLHRYEKCVKNLIKEKTNEYDVIVFSGCFMGSTLARYSKKYGIIPITIHHNYEAEFFQDNLKDSFSKRFIISKVKKAERRSYLDSDINFFLTTSDMKRFEEVYGKCKGENHLIATFEYEDNCQVEKRNNENGSLNFVITGALNNIQGVDGVKYFLNELYAKLPMDCKVIVAGKSPTEEIIDLCSKYVNVELIPNPVDMNVVLKKANVYICPTRLGGGMKLRVMDGLKHGIPVIVHKNSTRGYDMFYNTPVFKIFETPEEFGLQLNELIAYTGKEIPVQNDVVELYKSLFSLEAGIDRIKKALEKVIQL